MKVFTFLENLKRLIIGLSREHFCSSVVRAINSTCKNLEYLHIIQRKRGRLNITNFKLLIGCSTKLNSLYIQCYHTITSAGKETQLTNELAREYLTVIINNIVNLEKLRFEGPGITCDSFTEQDKQDVLLKYPQMTRCDFLHTE